MRILYVAHLLPYPPASGVALRTFHLTRLLAREHAVDWVGLCQASILKGLPREAARAAYEREAGVRVLALFPRAERGALGKALVLLRSHAAGVPYERGWLRGARLREVVLERVRRDRYDLVIGDTVGLADALASLPVPVLLGHHNVESDLAARRALGHAALARSVLTRESRLIRRIERHAASAIADHMVPSRKDASVLAQAVAPARIRTWVVPSGVDTEHFAPQARAERTHDAVFVGSLGWHPNRAAVERIAALVPHLTRELGRAPRIRIVGRSAGFESVLRPLLAVPELEFCGFVPDARVEMARARVLLAPLAYGGGTKLKVLNALACGLPVVTSAAGAEGLEVGEADGVYVREGAEALARETARLVRDDVAWRAASAAARHAAASRFSWHAVASALRQAVRGATPALEAAR